MASSLPLPPVSQQSPSPSTDLSSPSSNPSPPTPTSDWSTTLRSAQAAAAVVPLHQQQQAPLQQLQQFQQLHQLQPHQQVQSPRPPPHMMMQQQVHQHGAVATAFPPPMAPSPHHQQQQHHQHFQQQHPQHMVQQHQQFQQQPQHAAPQQRILGTAYTPEQREALEEIYSVWDTFTKQQERDETFALHKKIGLTTIQIRGWIQNRKKRGQYKGKQVLAPEQVRILEWVFVNHSNYPSVKLKQKLACELGLKYSRIRTWFQSRRQRGVPAVLTRISQENDSEWNETVQKLRNLIEAVKVEDAFFLRFPFKGPEGDLVGSSGGAEDTSSTSLKSTRAGPLQITDHQQQQQAHHQPGMVAAGSLPSTKVTSSPPLRKDSSLDLPPTSFSPPASLPSRPSSLNFPPEFPLNLLNTTTCDLSNGGVDPQQKRKLNYLWKGSLDSPEKRRRMTQIPSKGGASPFIPPCHQQIGSNPQVRSEPFPKTLPSWRENLVRLNLENGPSSARSPCPENQSLPRLHLPSQFSPESPPPALSPTPSAFVSSDPGASSTSSWTTDSSDGSSTSSRTSPLSQTDDEILRPKSLSPSQGGDLPNGANACEASSSMPLLPSIRELERAAERSSFSIPQIQ